MLRSRNIVPNYPRHKQSRRARARWTDANSQRHERLLPGKYGSAESRKAFAKLQLEIETAPVPTARVDGLSLVEMVVAYWGDLENLIQKETKAERVCVFAGPVLQEDDLVFQGRDERGPTSIQIPRKYWKIVVAIGDDGRRAYGFVLEQDLSDVPLEFAVPMEWRRHMQGIGEIEAMLNSWAKLTWLKEHDAIDTEEGRRVATGAKASGRM